MILAIIISDYCIGMGTTLLPRARIFGGNRSSSPMNDITDAARGSVMASKEVNEVSSSGIWTEVRYGLLLITTSMVNRWKDEIA